MRILIIEDNQIFAEALADFLERRGFAVDIVGDGEHGLKRLRLSNKEYDLVILDWMLPGVNGDVILSEVRKENITLPVLMLTAKDALDDKVYGLGKGADDYLSKDSFQAEEVLARIKAFLRRPRESLPEKLRAGRLSLDPVSQRVFLDKKEIKLTLREYSLLEYLMRNPGKVIQREQIWDHVWDFATNAMSNAVDVHIHNLRKKIGKRGSALLETITGVGYRLNAA